MVMRSISQALDIVRARRRWLFLLGIVLLFFLFSVAVAWQLAVLYRQLDVRQGQNTLWSLTQAQNHGALLERDGSIHLLALPVVSLQ